METLYLPQFFFGNDFKNVYEPAEDTFILLDALENDLITLKNNSRVCLECGSGSGIIITSIAKSFAAASTKTATKNGSNAANDFRLLLATDINFKACQTTQKCATYFGQEHNVQVIQTDLAECLLDRLEQSVDLLVFNPPYVPTEEDPTSDFKKSQTSKKKKNQLINLAWAGGKHGRSVIDVFLKNYVKKLLSKPYGVAYIVALEANNIDDLTKCLEGSTEGGDDDAIVGSVALKRRAGSESLYVLKYQYANAKSNK